MRTDLTQLAGQCEGTKPPSDASSCLSAVEAVQAAQRAAQATGAPALPLDPHRDRLAADRAAREQEARTRSATVLATKAAHAKSRVARALADALAAYDGAGSAASTLTSSPPPSPPLALLEEIQRGMAASQSERRGEDYARVSVGEAQPLAADQTAAAERAAAERELQQLQAELGSWSQDEEDELRQMEPRTAAEHEEASSRFGAGREGAHLYAIARLAQEGSARGLAYALQCMLRVVGLHRPEVIGGWVVNAMGLGHDGRCERQLWTQLARRLLNRQFAIWVQGRYERQCDVAGSRSAKLVRGTRKVTQRWLSGVCRYGAHRWSRRTMARDASYLHRRGAVRRVRLPVDVAPKDERSGPSGQVVSRYFSFVPMAGARSERRGAAAALGELASKLAGSGRADLQARLEWVRDVAAHALCFCVGAVPHHTVIRTRNTPAGPREVAYRARRSADTWPVVPGLMEPDATAPP